MDRDFSRTAWEPAPVDENPRPRRSWKRTFLILGLLFVLPPVVLFGGRVLTASVTSGTITFATTATGCTVGTSANSFPAGTAIFGTAILERGVSPGEALALRVLKDQDVVSETLFSILETGMCTSNLVDDGQLGPGTYRVTYTVGSEVLAEGTFEVTQAVQGVS